MFWNLFLCVLEWNIEYLRKSYTPLEIHVQDPDNVCSETTPEPL